MSSKATDIAYNYLLEKKEGSPFAEIWSHIAQELGYSEDIAKRKISQFYTDLSLDGRFIQLENNLWNLKLHCKYDEVALSQKEVEEEVDEDDEEEESYEVEEIIEEEEY